MTKGSKPQRPEPPRPLYPNFRELIRECKPGMSLRAIAAEAGVPRHFTEDITRQVKWTGQMWPAKDIDRWVEILGCPVERVWNALLADLPGYVDDACAEIIHQLLMGWAKVPEVRRPAMLELFTAQLDLTLGKIGVVLDFVESVKET